MLQERSLSALRLAGALLNSDIPRGLVARARRIATDYRIIIERDPDGGYIGTSIELPGIVGDGETAEECHRSTRELLAAAVVALIQDGQLPPTRDKRTVQVNVRLTGDEKLRLSEAVRRAGLRSLSDLLRVAALEFARR